MFIGDALYDHGAIIYNPEKDPGSLYRFDTSVPYDGPLGTGEAWYVTCVISNLFNSGDRVIIHPLGQGPDWVTYIPAALSVNRPPTPETDWDAAAAALLASQSEGEGE